MSLASLAFLLAPRQEAIPICRRTVVGRPAGAGMENPTRNRARVLPTIARADRCDHRGMALSVLLVDDDPVFLSLAERILAGIGAVVVATAAEPVGALAAANETRPDAAVVDVGLPDREGIDLAYQLAALPWKPRVVLVSSDGDAG